MMKHKIAIGRTHAGFVLNLNIEKYLMEKFNVSAYYILERHDPRLIEAIEHEVENGRNPHLYSWGKIKIKEINCNEYYISEYDASESVVTPDTITWVEIQ